MSETPYLRKHTPSRRQFRSPRRLDRSPIPGKATGCTGLHTAEGAMDSVGADTGAENVARYMLRNPLPASYHHIVDSDSHILLVDLDDEAYADGTGSNPWATSLSFACRTIDWDRMGRERRAAFLHQGALAFKAQQDWRAARGYPLTELRLLTKAESDRGESGFVYHGVRDPGRRTDPGTTPTAPFPFYEFLDACRAVITPPQEDEDMPISESDHRMLRLSMLEQANKAVAPALAALKSVSRQVADLDASVDTDEVVAKLDDVIARLTPKAEDETESDV